MMKKTTRLVSVGTVKMGGDSPVSIQSMTNTDTKDIEATSQQIKRLIGANCEVIRMALYDTECVGAFRELRKAFSDVPFVADIHFDYRIALGAIEAGVDKIRLNPGNIEEEWKIREVAMAAKAKGVPIRVGANSGSINKRFRNLERTPALVESALEQVRLLERHGFEDIVIAVKSSDVRETIEANRILSEKTDYPLHLGVTEAGPLRNSLIKTSAALGTLLLEGIGDTIRYSISGDPVEESMAARQLLLSLGLRKGIQLVSCPTCARTTINMEEYTSRVSEMIKGVEKPLTVAIMGCVVNGMGEGEHADLGIAGTKSGGVIFRNGEIVGKYDKEHLFEEFERLLKKLITDD
ncbi:MAG TPA: flavodoxin-dependent (E)-4-hydroxy-3-methylbut-2-enyl-diphosphate synthase [Thermotogota bacterium]|nr:flavodoxin-dependent (E)-4-hydroxy-3-methylbut-2-enyl-diphosphate synthase [Thermotogota bacterium]